MVGVVAWPQVACQIIGDSVCGVGARWEPRLPVPLRNMVLLRGLLVLSLFCLQGPYLVVSLGRGLGLGGEGRWAWERPEV